MGNCKNCFTSIQDGEEYCKDCAKIREESQSEDSLQMNNNGEFSEELDIDDVFSLMGSAEEPDGVTNGADIEDLSEDYFSELNNNGQDLDGIDLGSSELPIEEAGDNSDPQDLLLSEEVLSIDNLLGNVDQLEESFSENKMNKQAEAGVFGDGTDLSAIFSDALGAVSELEDFSEEEDISSKLIAEVNVENKKEENKTNKQKVKAEKKGFFEKLFANVVDEEEEAEEARLEEERKAKIAAKKAKMAQAKVKDVQPREKGIKGLLQFLKKDKDKEEAKKAKKLLKDKKMAEKELKKRSKQEAQPEVPIYEGKINKKGAAIIFTLFGILAVGILAGTDVFSYSRSISLAGQNFEAKKYNAAYEEIHGLKVREKDIELSDKIMTVMFVNKQLNSYNNFYSMKAYPEALDSLLKGLKRYDKYIALAKEIGAESDLNYVRAQIIKELDHYFQLSEAEAMDILSSKDQGEYSIKVHNAILEKMPKPKDGTQ